MPITVEDLERRFTGLLLGNRYRLENVVGHGGMGAVFRARDELLNRAVAVKVICVENAENPEVHRLRFRREAEVAAQLNHPNVVVVHDFGSQPEPGAGAGLDYIVMQLLPGEDLAAYLSRCPGLARTNLPLAAAILRQAAEGVAAGHREEIVHRDIKPRNLVLVADGPGRVLVRVVDFGLARSHTNPAEFGEITLEGGFVGSVRYASPEQLRGRTELGPPSDVFSLGVVGYELLTGVHPFTDNDRTRLSAGLDVPPPRGPRRLNGAIPQAVDDVLLRCLRIAPAERYADAGELIQALEDAWRTTPVAGAWPWASDAGDRTEEDGTILQPLPQPAPGTLPHPVPLADRAPSANAGVVADAGAAVDGIMDATADRIMDAAVDSSPGDGSADRRQGPTPPRPKHWVPGPRAWSVAAVIALLMTTGVWASVREGFVPNTWLRNPPLLQAGSLQHGFLGRGDSVLGSGSRYDVYRHPGKRGERLMVTVEPASFDGDLQWGRVRNGSWQTLETSDGAHPARIFVAPDDSTTEYRLRVRARNPAWWGRYSIRTTYGPRAITANEPVASTLGPADAEVTHGKVFFESWTLQARAGEQVNVSVHAEGWQPRVEWWPMGRKDWERVEIVMSGNRRGDVELTATPPTSGEYRFRVQNRDNRKAGRYTVRLTTGPRELRPGSPAESWLSSADAGYGSPVPVETWVYRGAPGTPVTLSLESDAAAVMDLRQMVENRWTTRASVSASNPTHSLRLRPPETGEYFVRVRGLDAASRGAYSLSATPDPALAGGIAVGQSVTGTFEPGDQHDGRYYQEWSFRGTPGETLSITMSSPQVFPALAFGCWDENGLWVPVDSASSNSSLTLTMFPTVRGTGDCSIRAESYYAPYGPQSYTLQVLGVMSLVPPANPPM
ncbi:MAG TPA: serine/threonine-protein kinase [Longimicrobium sp.]|nr:serine/threonine-protein kinase [Longimicrobium sp.]